MTNKPQFQKKNLYNVGGLMYWTLTLACAAFFLIGFSKELRLWQRTNPSVPLVRENWQIVVDKQKCQSASGEFNCSPYEILAMEDDAVPLDSPQGRELVSRERGNQLWFQYKIERESLQLASLEKANHLRLGWIKGDFKLWINGQLFGQWLDSDRNPKSILIPMNFLEMSEDLDIKIHLVPRKNAANIFPLNVSLVEGFSNSKENLGYNSFFSFQDKVKPLVIFFIYIVFSYFFYLLWFVNRNYDEYFHLSLMAVFCAVPEVLFHENFVYSVPAKFSSIIYVLAVFGKMGTVLTFSLAFSRRRERSIYALAIGSLFFLGGLSIAIIDVTTTDFRIFLNRVGVPVVFLIGAGVALYQFNFLITQDRFSHHLRSRVLRLAVFSLIYIGLAGVNYWQYSSYSDGLLARILWNLPEMSLILFLGSLAVFDYRNQVRILERVPISSYHRLPTLPSVLEGKLLVLDIKGSERLFKQASFVPGHELVVPTLLSHLWNTIQAHGGTVLRAEGDEIIAFFESSKNNSMNVILNALVECELHLSQVTGQFPVGEYEEWADVSEIHFRAAVVSGLIKPIWIGNEKERMPGWNQVGIEMPFVDCARLLEAEKNIKIENLENRSLVIMKTAEVKDDPEGFRHKGFLFHDLIVLSKGKSTYQVSVFDPSLANEKTKDAIGSQKNKAA